MINNLENCAGKKNINVSLEGSAVTVEGVRHVIYEMLYNITDNAIRYTLDGGDVKVFVGKLNGNRTFVWKIMESEFRRANSREFLNVFTEWIKAIP